ncbi:hypothetical protein [Clostridium guangxiense]|uniref:hypothetical protein n=1 Tax=Clostridium guangxiense TaxID=1662055 RepID=UPI001E5F8A93|nr:hypothetical protein [Clostridium guangxiense]
MISDALSPSINVPLFVICSCFNIPLSKTVSIAIENGVLKSKSIEDGIDQLTLKYKSKFKENTKDYTLNLL